MTWWQILIIIVCFTIAVIAGSLLGRALSRKWAFPFSQKKRAAAREAARIAAEGTAVETPKQSTGEKAAQKTGEKQAEQLAIEKAEREAEAARKAREAQEKERLEAERLAKEQAERLATEKAEQEAEAARQAKETPEKPVDILRPDILAEVSANLKIASAPWTGKPEPFRTAVWDNKNNDISYLPVELQYELSETYTDIRLANNIVWLLTEVGASGQEFEINYKQLCTRIAGRLKQIMERLSAK